MIEIDKNIIEDLIFLLGDLPCRQSARKSSAGLLYAYLVMRLSEDNINADDNDTDTGDNQSDQAD